MAEEKMAPFSARNRGAHAQIDNDFPETARVGLLHILHQLVHLRFVNGWDELSRELERIARVKPGSVSGKNMDVVERLLFELEWDKVFDFCERLHSQLAQEVTSYDELIVQRSQVQEYIANELVRLFLEEHLAFEFSNGLVRRRGRRQTADQVARAELVLGDPRLSSALAHFNKALKYFRSVSQPDFENVVKEAVCAVEATARALFPSGGSTLGEVVNSITGSEIGQLPKTIAKTFHGLYGFSSGGEGVRHGGAAGGAATKEIAEYSLAVAASQIVLLVDLSITLEPDVPF
jgi:AbiJ N-terminal domain 4